MIERFTSRPCRACAARSILIDIATGAPHRGRGLIRRAPARRPRSPTPLTWEELRKACAPNHFRVDNLRQRLRFLAGDPWQGFFELRQHVWRAPKKS